MKKKIAAIMLAVFTVGSLFLTVGFANALPMRGPISIFNSIQGAAGPFRPVQTSWVRVTGFINEWGATEATGMLQVHAKTALLDSSDTRQLAMASVVWSNMSRPINAIRAKENFTYTFYSARLMNASVSTLSLDTINFFLSGTWNVHTVESNVTIITNDKDEITSVRRTSNNTIIKAYGELDVTDNWTKFELTIEDIDPLTGSVVRTMTRQRQFNPFKVDVEDPTGNTVTKADFVTITKCYRAMPGWGNYDNKMDFNFNYKIDIADLSTVAANM